MTKPHSDDADAKSDEPEGESAAVGVRADTAKEQDTAKDETTDPVEGQANQAKDTGETDSAQGVEPPKAKRRTATPRQRARSVKARPTGQGPQPRARRAAKAQPADTADASDQPDQESLDGETKTEEPSDATEPAPAQDTAEAEATVSEDADAEEATEEAAEKVAEKGKRAKVKFRISWSRVLVYGLLPGLALVLAAAAGFLKWQDSSAREAQIAGIESVAAAKDSTIALLSYKSDTVEKDLEAAKDRMTGAFRESYSQLIKDVVIPGAKREHISSTATVPAVASVSATPNHAVTLLFVNQTVVVDKNPPTDSTSSVRVTLDKIGGRWLISGFDPV